MSGSDFQPPVCRCPNHRCILRYCNCFREKVLCSEKCDCRNCLNIEKNRVGMQQFQNAYNKPRKPIPPRMPTAGCRCKKIKCANGNCGCFLRSTKCTSKCTCLDCANSEEIRGSDKEQVDGNSSMAEEPAQMQEQPTQSGDNSGSGQNKRP